MSYQTNNNVYTPIGIINPQINNSKSQWLRTANANNKNATAVSMGTDLSTLFSKLSTLDPHYKKIIVSFLDTYQKTKLSSSVINQHVYNIGTDGSSSENDQTMTSYNSNLEAVISNLSIEERNLLNTIIASLRDVFSSNSGLTISQIKTILEKNVHYNSELKAIEILPKDLFINMPGASKQFFLIGHTYSGNIYNLANETVQWASSVTAVATIVQATGIATAVTDGTTTITATVSSIVPNITTTRILTVTGQ